MRRSGQREKSDQRQQNDGTERFEGGYGARALAWTGSGEHYKPYKQKGEAEGLANFLGWFSIGLGVAQIVAPDAVAKLVGIKPTRRNIATMRSFGMREVTSGIGILSQPRPQGWVWSRVAGDALDLATLGRSMTSGGNSRVRTTAAVAAVAGVTVLDILAAKRLGKERTSHISEAGRRDEVPVQRGHKSAHAIRTTHTVTVNKSAEEIYAFWRNFENLPRFLRHLESVEVLDDRRSRWTASAPAGASVSWEAEITEDRPNELIAWRSVPGSTVPNAGTVQFTPAAGGRGTEVRVDMEYNPPGGAIGSKIAMLFREEPQTQIKDDLRAFKQVMEVGEVLRSDASIRKGPRHAQPPREQQEPQPTRQATSSPSFTSSNSASRADATMGAEL